MNTERLKELKRWCDVVLNPTQHWPVYQQELAADILALIGDWERLKEIESTRERHSEELSRDQKKPLDANDALA